MESAAFCHARPLVLASPAFPGDTADMSEEEAGHPPVEDVKAKMKEALDAKHAHEKAGQAHLDGTSKAQHTHGKTGGPQRFQRKSG